MKQHLCKVCGETNSFNFYPNSKGKCKACISKQNKNKSHNLNELSETKQRVRLKKIQSSGCTALYKIKRRRIKITNLISTALQPKGIFAHTTNTFIQTVILNHGNVYGFDKTVYVDASTPVIITCLKHNYDFSVSAAALLRKTERNGGKKKDPIVGSCPKCREEYFDGIKKEMINKFRIVHNNEYDYDESTYINYETPFTAICRTHGPFQILGSNHIKGENKCPECWKEKKHHNEKLVDDNRYYVCEIHGDISIGKTRNLSQGCPNCNVEKANLNMNILRIEKIKKKFGNIFDFENKPDGTLILTCKKHGEQIVLSPGNSYGEKKYLCLECRYEATQKVYDDEKKELSFKCQNVIKAEYNYQYEFLEFLDKGGPKDCRISLLNKYNNKQFIVRPKTILGKTLPKDHRFVMKTILPYEEARAKVQALGIKSFREYKKWFGRTKPDDLPTNPQVSYKEWTSYCDFFGTDAKKNMSFGEKRINEYLNNKDIEFVWQKTFPDCRNINCLRFDFYLPQYNLLIEFDGEQHFREAYYGGHIELAQQNFEQQKHNDAIKTKYCQDKNIKLLRLDYMDLDNNLIEYRLDAEISTLYSNQLLGI